MVNRPTTNEKHGARPERHAVSGCWNTPVVSRSPSAVDLHLIFRSGSTAHQDYVFGHFHPDLRPANLYVVPSNIIVQVDSRHGVNSLMMHVGPTRYGWPLFHWDIDGAVTVLICWLASTRGRVSLECETRHAWPRSFRCTCNLRASPTGGRVR